MEGGDMRVHIFALVLTLAPGFAFGQDAQASAVEGGYTAPTGWSFTPALAYAGTWDDNALVRGIEEEPLSDYTNVLNPSGELAYIGRRGQLTANYSGSWVLYSQLAQLNSFDQRMNFSGTRRLTRRVSLFSRGGYTTVPTTELLEIVAVPYVRVGSQLLTAAGGADIAVNKHTSLVFTYAAQKVIFDRHPVFGLALLGGHSHGVTGTVRRTVDPRLSLSATYDVQRAAVRDGSRFDVQRGEGGMQFRFDGATTFAGTLGFARLGFSGPGPHPDQRSGLTWSAALARQFRTGAVEGAYSRSFVPSYGFGGTSQNEEIIVRWRQPLSRRTYATSAVAWRRNEPLRVDDLSLKTFWVEGVVGYAARPWLHIEGFYTRANQNIRRAGGEFSHGRLGFQVVTLRPVRIR
jgi:hypothetical protein